ncbi:RNA-binding S4 domain-containing protein [Synechococcus sp. UW140]|uniref:RNA-binding S4 domain-containing protein n=1 Tax=Synechococcus sp. UW140 TaxID=368503 RepID=UPI0031378EB5
MQLDQFLKFHGLVGTGGEAKLLIQGSKVRVNGQIESRRGRKLQAGDQVELGGEMLTVAGEANT